LSDVEGGFAVLIVEHERAVPAGLLHEWLRDRGAAIDELRIDVDEREIDAREYDLVVALGSGLAAYDDTIHWIEREKRLLEEAAAADVPVLGICFGGQLLARVLGARCYRASEPEIGWLSVRSDDQSVVPEGPWFQWHFDAFAAPPGATLVAESDVGPQAFVAGRSLGLQFHPEVTPQIVEDWVRLYRHKLDDAGVDADALLDETRRRAESARVMARAFFDGFLEHIAGIPPRHARAAAQAPSRPA
jgi:GMP synthase-like glutamine amidotransferase